MMSVVVDAEFVDEDADAVDMYVPPNGHTHAQMAMETTNREKPSLCACVGCEEPLDLPACQQILNRKIHCKNERNCSKNGRPRCKALAFDQSSQFW